MQAVVIQSPGGPEVLALQRLPDPAVGPEQVGVSVRATALNRADLLQRRGRYPAPPGAPANVPGLEFAGDVETVGARVRGVAVGDRVMGILGGGGYAERVCVHEALCLPVPPGLGFEEAAAIPEAFLTAYDALFRLGRLSPGEALLVPAAGSGVGTAAVQMAGVGGVRVIGLARSADKRRRLERLAPIRVLDPERGGLLEAIRAASDGGVDLVLDLIGAAAWRLHLEALRERGRIVLIGLLGGARTDVDLFALMRKRVTVIGSVMRSRPPEEKLSLVREFRRRILPRIAEGHLRPVIDRCFDWSEAAAAHARMEANENFGKIVLRVP